MIAGRTRLAALLSCIVLGAPPAPSAEPCTPDRVTILTAAGPQVFAVEVADDPAEQQRGLMFRPALAEDRGMLFIFDPPRRAAFWMRNTMIPLDMLFIDDTGRIETIVERTDTFSDRVSRSRGKVRAVLEIAGGLARRLGIRVGDRVRHPAFRTAPAGLRCSG